MSTLATATFHSDSEDEHDGDFVPDQPKQKSRKGKGKRPRGVSLSDSGSSSPSTSDDEGEQKKPKLEDVTEAEERRRKALEEFRAMQSEDKAITSGNQERKVELVSVQRARRFAGETLYETVELPANDPEAIAFLAKKISSESPSQEAVASPIAEDSSASASLVETPATPAAAKPKPKPAPRRKPRQSLEAMAAAIDKGKKMTTLEKSQLDWKSHMATADDKMREEVEANRRGGGYLEKRDFLERVEERRDGLKR
ncbi:hypothetical protein P7C73_g6477, partial [Tremellales sp. Uapishka_1]